jgi:hypothetical protein
VGSAVVLEPRAADLRRLLGLVGEEERDEVGAPRIDGVAALLGEVLGHGQRVGEAPLRVQQIDLEVEGVGGVGVPIEGALGVADGPVHVAALGEEAGQREVAVDGVGLAAHERVHHRLRVVDAPLLEVELREHGGGRTITGARLEGALEHAARAALLTREQVGGGEEAQGLDAAGRAVEGLLRHDARGREIARVEVELAESNAQVGGLRVVEQRLAQRVDGGLRIAPLDAELALEHGAIGLGGRRPGERTLVSYVDRRRTHGLIGSAFGLRRATAARPCDREEGERDERGRRAASGHRATSPRCA